LTSGPSDALAASAFADELDAAPYLASWLGVADMAHVALLARAGVIEQARAARLLQALVTLDEEAQKVELDPATGDLFNNRDAFLADQLGAEAGVVHTGRARREAMTLAWQLTCRERIVEAGRALARLLEVLAARAREHRASVMPDYTYLQAAQPTTLGHYLLGFVYPLLRDNERLMSAYAVTNRSPGGSGSVNGSRFDFDRDWLAQLLEFDAVIAHTRDAMWAPDIATEQLAALVMLLTNVDRLAEDAQIWTTAEFGFMELDDAHARTSVIMPNKKNPYALAWSRGRARFLLGRFVGVVGTFLTPTGQPDNRITAYPEVPRALDDASACTNLVAEVFERAHFDIARMSAAAHEGHLYATDLCDLLVERSDLDNRSVHRVVGLAIRDRIDHGGGALCLDDITHAADALGVSLPAIDEAEFKRTLEPEYLVGLRQHVGGAASKPMEEMLSATEARAAKAGAYWAQHPAITFRERFLQNIRRLIQELEQ
jgi:argininosuccinate lyase